MTLSSSGSSAEDRFATYSAPDAVIDPSTVFVPYTGNVYYVNATNHDVAVKSSFASVNSTFTNFSASVTTTTTSPLLNRENDNVAFTVGVICGAVGLLLIVIVAGIMCLCKIKKSKDARSGRRASVLKKNPQEKTFEPLDLSLTVARYEASTNPLELQQKHDSCVKTAPCIFQTEFEQSVDIVTSESNLTNKEIEKCKYNLNQSAEADDSKDAVSACENLSVKSFRPPTPNRKLDWEKRLISVSARESFSSGLGTGIESDIHSWESKNFYTPLSESICEIPQPSTTGKLSSLRNAPDKRYGSSSVLLDGRSADGWHRVKQFAPGNRRKPFKLKSEASSSCASSGSSSMNDWMSANASASIDQAEGSLSTISHLDLLENDQNLSYEEKTKSCRESSLDDDPNHQKDDFNQDEGVVSTYFDLHFPPPMLKLNESKLDLEDDNVKKNSSYDCNNRNLSTAALEDDFDEVIEL